MNLGLIFSIGASMFTNRKVYNFCDLKEKKSLKNYKYLVLCRNEKINSKNEKMPIIFVMTN